MAGKVSPHKLMGAGLGFLLGEGSSCLVGLHLCPRQARLSFLASMYKAFLLLALVHRLHIQAQPAFAKFFDSILHLSLAIPFSSSTQHVPTWYKSLG